MLKEEAIVTTYLEMLSPAAARGQRSQVRGQKLSIKELKSRDWKFNRDMYFKVGDQWRWIDKRPWTDEQWQEYANDPGLRTFAGYCGGELAGYYELARAPIGEPRADNREQVEIEIAYFGLLPEFIGRGLGGALLTSAIETAWAWLPTPSRVWVHTCNRDHPSALANYQARGFKIYKEVICDQ